MDTIILEAPAKINLYLAVWDKLANGYHHLDMLMQSVSLSDRITLKRTKCSGGVSVVYPNHSAIFAIPENEENLAYKAWRLLQKEYGISEEITISIEKHIPVGAGLAGGSSDAAAVLRGCNQLFQLDISAKELAQLGADLGGDVPFCVIGGLARAQGIGEKLTPLFSLPQRNFVLVNPGIPVLTSEIFQFYDTMNLSLNKDRVAEKKEAIKDFLVVPTWAKVDNLLFNALETPAIACYPVIAEIMQDLKEIGLVPFMSGSGPSVIAFWETPKEKAAIIQRIVPKWPLVTFAHTL